LRGVYDTFIINLCLIVLFLYFQDIVNTPARKLAQPTCQLSQPDRQLAKPAYKPAKPGRQLAMLAAQIVKPDQHIQPGYIQIAPQILVPDVPAGGSNTLSEDDTCMNALDQYENHELGDSITG